MRLREISKVISFGVEGKKFLKRWRHDVLLVLFWLGALEFKILKFLFFCCLNIFLGNFFFFYIKSNRKLFSCISIAWYKHVRGWKNSQQLCKPPTKSRVCITVSNSSSPSRVYIRLCKHGKPFPFVQTVRTLNLDLRPTPDHQKEENKYLLTIRLLLIFLRYSVSFSFLYRKLGKLT